MSYCQIWLFRILRRFKRLIFYIGILIPFSRENAKSILSRFKRLLDESGVLCHSSRNRRLQAMGWILKVPLAINTNILFHNMLIMCQKAGFVKKIINYKHSYITINIVDHLKNDVFSTFLTLFWHVFDTFLTHKSQW